MVKITCFEPILLQDSFRISRGRAILIYQGGGQPPPLMTPLLVLHKDASDGPPRSRRLAALVMFLARTPED